MHSRHFPFWCLNMVSPGLETPPHQGADPEDLAVKARSRQSNSEGIGQPGTWHLLCAQWVEMLLI